MGNTVLETPEGHPGLQGPLTIHPTPQQRSSHHETSLNSSVHKLGAAGQSLLENPPCAPGYWGKPEPKCARSWHKSSPLTFELLQHVPHTQAALGNAVVFLQGHGHSLGGGELYPFTPEERGMPMGCTHSLRGGGLMPFCWLHKSIASLELQLGRALGIIWVAYWQPK